MAACIYALIDAECQHIVLHVGRQAGELQQTVAFMYCRYLVEVAPPDAAMRTVAERKHC